MGRDQEIALTVEIGLFSFKTPYIISLTASIGFEAKNRVVSAIFVCP